MELIGILDIRDNGSTCRNLLIWKKDLFKPNPFYLIKLKLIVKNIADGSHRSEKNRILCDLASILNNIRRCFDTVRLVSDLKGL